MNCNVPTDICFSFAGFRARGGTTGEHSDGWGIAFFEGRGVRVFLDPAPSARSPIADLVNGYPIRSLNVVAHIRKATQGEVRLENTHPFQRELWGRHWLFAHNGNLPGFAPQLDGPYAPVGDTDSERAFCDLLTRLRARFAHAAPERTELFAAIAHMTAEIAAFGTFNYLLSNGDWLIAHCATKLHHIVRQAPFSTALLKDDDVAVDFSQVTTPDDRVAVIATQPLTVNEQWTEMPPRSLWLFVDGAPLRQVSTL